MTSLSIAQIDACRSAMLVGLQGLSRKAPQTPVEWADENFYLSSESSYQEGRWETLPFQVAMLNAMGNDEIRTVNVRKSARVGYSKLLIAVAGYMVEHKRRNILFLVPSDTSSDGFMKSQIETMIRDVPAVRDLAPWYGIKNHRDSTLDAKRFSHGKQLFCRGGKAAKNYRELSVDTVIYDELAAFDYDVEKEGSPTFLGDKRVEGSSFPKSIRGSTPKIKGPVDEGGCQIEAAADESPHLFKFHIPCPHCGAEQDLKWGGKDCGFGIKWDPGKPQGAWYQCEVNACVIQQHEMQDQQVKGRWICERTSIWTRTGFDFFDSDDRDTPTPDSVSFHIWTAYSPFTTWGRIAAEFLLAKGAANTLKTFTNTTLGETWEEDQGEKVEWQLLFGRREVWKGVPARAVALMGGVDTQGDRYEGRVWAFGAGEECWLIHRFILYGNPASDELKRQVSQELHRQFIRSDGQVMKVERWCWDSGGNYTDEVYGESRKHGVQWVIPIRGAPIYGKPIANMPRTRNKIKKVFLTEVGTDNAKELIYARLKLPVDTSRSQAGLPQPGVIHLPADDDLCDEDELKQLTAETKILKIVGGRRVPRWDAAKRRNEALDCLVYALAALRISQQRFGLDLDLLQIATGGGPEQEPKERPRVKSSHWKR